MRPHHHLTTFVPMNAWVLHKHGTTKEAFQLRQVPDPEPGPGQLLIRSEGFGLNYADVMARRGLYRDAPPVPSVIGYETVGRVERCGAGVPPERLGQRVVAMTRFGGYAELAVTDHRAAAVVPDALGIGEACALATQGCTAWYMARYACPLREGQRVLIHSVAGGVGQLLVQLAVKAGCEVFAIASGAEKMAYLKQLGAQHVIDRSTGDYATAVEHALGSHRLDVSFNAVGGSTFKEDMALRERRCGGVVRRCRARQQRRPLRHIGLRVAHGDHRTDLPDDEEPQPHRREHAADQASTSRRCWGAACMKWCRPCARLAGAACTSAFRRGPTGRSA
ncbi:MAG: zinc-binding dehydrogenase [Flavobacteriales bacterium]|nr:zinc-binding dehydrogenase [Flavobacteriales bacterium]